MASPTSVGGNTVGAFMLARLAAEANTPRASVDNLDVQILIGGESTGTARLSDYRFEGFVDPEAYLTIGEGGSPIVITQRSPWTESLADIGEALALRRTNRSRQLRVLRRKAERLRVGARGSTGLGRPAQPQEVVAQQRANSLNATTWLARIREAGVQLSASYVNLGAADGVADDPLHDFSTRFVREAGGQAFAVEADAELCRRHRQQLPWVHLACDRISMQNIQALIAQAFPSAEARRNLDVLKVDVDSFEGPLVEECLWPIGLRPKLLLVEINAAIPPPLQYALLDSPQLRRRYPALELALVSEGGERMEVNPPMAGVSVSYLARRLAPEYALLELASPDAILVRRDILASLGVEPLDEFEAYARGWADVHGIGRRQLRRWYFELDEVEALGEVREQLTKWMETHLGEVLPFSLAV